MLGTWPCPAADNGKNCAELAICFDNGRKKRVLVLPALFDEANKLRHFTIEVMRALERCGVDSFLPDFSGCNESTEPLQDQSLAVWQNQSRAAASYFAASHILAIRGGALLDPGHLPGLHFAPVEGIGLLRAMLRARVLSDKEAGIVSDRDTLLEHGTRAGLTLAGYRLGPEMIVQLASGVAPHSAATGLTQSAIGGGALWLRAEPAHDPAQAAKLASLVAGEHG